jgi:hypothetical protein
VMLFFFRNAGTGYSPFCPVAGRATRQSLRRLKRVVNENRCPNCPYAVDFVAITATVQYDS